MSAPPLPLRGWSTPISISSLFFTMLFFLVVAAFLPFFSLALPSSHIHSFNHRSPLRPRILTYYPDWAPPKSIDYSLFDAVIFAFALPDQNYQLRWDTDQAPALLANIVPAAHANSTKVMLSVGGWTGSRPVPSSLTYITPHSSTRYFSNAVATAQNRETFVNNILDTYKRYDLDGIDIDWEYPGQVSQQGNTESATDSQNMVQFFKVLRQKLPPGALISAAVQDSTFVGPDGQPMKDVSAFSHSVDWITLMNYDTYSSMLFLLIYYSSHHPLSSPPAPGAKRPPFRRLRQLLTAFPECRRWLQCLDLSRISSSQDRPRCPCIWLHYRLRYQKTLRSFKFPLSCLFRRW